MAEFSKFQELWDDMDSTLRDYRSEVKALRASVEVPDSNTHLSNVYDAFVAARRTQDRAETILAEVGMLRSRVMKLVTDLSSTYDDAWREAMATTRTGEYSSAKERDAMYDTKSLNELMNVRRGKRMLADVQEVYDYVKLLYQGIDSSRRDLDSRLRVANFEPKTIG